MSAPTPLDIAVAIAAVVSAIGGCAGALAAFRSARSASEAARSTEEAVRRAALREISSTASTIGLEVARVHTRAAELDTAYQAAAVSSGSFAHSGYEELRRNASVCSERAGKFAEDAALFTAGARSLAQVPPDELDRVLLRLTESLATVRALHDEVDRKYSEVSSENAEERARRLAAKYAK
jgi:hypothetical protein